MNKPNFFIVGAPRCGTTAMYAYLRTHPDIYLSPQKELYYFGQDLTYVNFARPTETEYLTFFAPATHQTIIGEASVTYLYSQQAAAEIKAYSPDARILIMLRNPVDMMYSIYSQMLLSPSRPVAELSEALRLDVAPAASILRTSAEHGQRLIRYRDLVSFTEQVARYFEVFGRQRVHVVIYDDFRDDTALVYRQVLQFLGVDDRHTPASFEPVNQNKVWRSGGIIRLMESPAIRKAARGLVPSRRFRQRLVSGIRSLMARETARPPLSDRHRAQLMAELADEIRTLSALLDRDLTRLWSAPDETDISR